MKICFIGPSGSVIPPTGWGAVESLIWDYYLEVKKNPEVQGLILTDPISVMVQKCNLYEPDVVYIMYDDYAYMAEHLMCNKIYLMTHFAFITSPHLRTTFGWYYNEIFLQAIRYQQFLTLNALSEEIAEVYRNHGFRGEINVISNGASADAFRYTDSPLYPLRSIYVGKIEERKKQHRYQSLPNLYFAGNYQDSPFDVSMPRYLGEWQKHQLYEELTNYTNLVLLSDGEADPLVVKEALMAGLGVVVSECASANLDRGKPYITIIPDDKLEDIYYVTCEVEKNRIESLRYRKQIREYALKNFSWEVVVKKFMQIVKDN